MDRIDTALRGISKSLRDAVLPAVDPADPLAQDQLGLAVRYVDFLRDRIDLLHGRERAELRYQAGIAAILLELAPEASAARRLAALAEAAHQTLADPDRATSDIRDCRDQLGAASANLAGLRKPARSATRFWQEAGPGSRGNGSGSNRWASTRYRPMPHSCAPFCSTIPSARP